MLIPCMLFSNTAVIDSLNNQLNVVKGKKKVDVLNELAKAYKGTFPEKMLEYGKQALELSKKIDYTGGEAQAFINIATAYFVSSDYHKSIELFIESKLLFEKIDDKKNIAQTLNNIGLVYNNLGKYEIALDYHLKSLKIREEIQDKNGIAASLNNVGNINWEMSNYNNALEYYNKSLQIYEEIDDKEGIAITNNNIGNISYVLKEFEESLKCFMKSLAIYEETDNKYGIAAASNNIAFVYQVSKNYNKALEYSFKSLKTSKELEEKFGIANTSNNIGNLYLQLENYDESFSYYRRSLKIAREIKAKTLIQNSYQSLSDLYSIKENYPKAIEYYKLYTSVKDSIFTEESSAKIAEMQTKYETEQKEKENELLKKNLEISSLHKLRLLLFLLGSILIIAVVMIFLILRVRVNHHLRIANKDLAISKENTEQIRKQLALINTMLRHDLANNFIVIKSALQLYNEEKDEKMLEEADIKCDNGLELINSMRELEFSRGDDTFLKPIDLKQVIDKISPEFSSMKIRLRDNCKIRADEAFESVMHNIMENAQSHGKARNIIISFEEFSDFTEIKIHNDGEQIPSDIHEKIFEKEFVHGDTGHTGMGLFIVRQNINRYGGSIYVEENDKPGVNLVINLKRA